jgi:thioredoxin-related protein
MFSKWIAIVFSFCLCSTAAAQGIEFFQGSLDEAKEVARQSGKLIFVDAFTTWCGPCKRMSRNIFPLEEVGSVYNDAFINLKLDMEKGEGRNFQRQYRVNAFPTFLFLDHSGKIVHRVTGGMDAGRFIQLGEFAASKNDVSSSMDKEYEDGKRDPEFMATYIEARVKAGRPVIQMTNEYLRSQPDLSGEHKLRILFHGASEVDSRIFTLMVKEQEDIEALFGSEVVAEKIASAGKKTVQKAMQYSNADLLEEAIDKVDRYAPAVSKEFEYEARLSYYTYTGETDEYLKQAKGYVKLGNEQKFAVVNNIISKLNSDPSLMKAANDWAEELAEDQPSESNCYLAARVKYLNSDYASAQKLAERALELAQENKSKAIPHIEKLLKSIGDKTGTQKS